MISIYLKVQSFLTCQIQWENDSNIKWHIFSTKFTRTAESVSLDTHNIFLLTIHCFVSLYFETMLRVPAVLENTGIYLNILEEISVLENTWIYWNVFYIYWNFLYLWPIYRNEISMGQRYIVFTRKKTIVLLQTVGLHYFPYIQWN